MPAHKMHGPASTCPKPRTQRVRKKPIKYAPSAVSRATAASKAPKAPKPPTHRVPPASSSSPHDDDLYVDITVGDYSTHMSVATLHSHPSALIDAYAHDFACNRRSAEGRIALNLLGDGNSFRLVETFMATGRLPPALEPDQIKYLRRSAKPLAMPRLERELSELYPLREAIRQRSSDGAAQPCGYITDVLLYAAALVNTDGAHDEVLDCLTALPTAKLQPDDLTLAINALVEPEVRRSSLMFAYIMLRRMSTPKRLAYFKAIVGRPATGFYMHGDMGEQLVRAGLINLSELFLQKARKITSESTLAYQAQNIRTRFLSLGGASESVIIALGPPEGAQEHPVTASTLGRALTQKRRWPEAMQVLQRTLTYDLPDELVGPTHDALGTCYRAQHRLEDAVHQFHLAHHHTPYDSTICASLGSTLHKLDQYTEAHRWRSLVVMFEPKCAQAQLCLGETLTARGHFAEALKRFEMAEHIAGQDIATLQDKVFAAERLGNWSHAITNQRKIIALSIDDPEHWRRLAYYYTQDQQPIAAHGAAQQSLRLHEANEPDNPPERLLPTLSASRPATPEPATPAIAPEVTSFVPAPEASEPFNANDYLLFDVPEL